MTQPQTVPGTISYDFRPEVEMCLALHERFPSINGANRPPALDRTLNRLFELIEVKANLQISRLRETEKENHLRDVLKEGAK